MNDTWRNDPILRTILIIFAGLLIFGFLFGFNFGGTGGGMAVGHDGHHGAGMGTAGTGDLFGGLLSGLITFSIKMLVLVLIFALLAGIIAGVRRYVAQQGGWQVNSPVWEFINRDPVLRIGLFVVAGIFGLNIIFAIFNSLDFLNVGGYMYSPLYPLFLLMGFLIKLLMVVFVVSLIIALVQFVKGQCFAAKDAMQGGEAITPQDNSEK